MLEPEDALLFMHCIFINGKVFLDAWISWYWYLASIRSIKCHASSVLLECIPTPPSIKAVCQNNGGPHPRLKLNVIKAAEVAHGN